MNWAHKKVELGWNYTSRKFVVKTIINTFFCKVLENSHSTCEKAS